MSSASLTPRLTRLTILAVAGVTAVSMAACSSSNDHKPSASPTSAGAPAKGKPQVAGLIASVSGNAIQVTGKKGGKATVDFGPATKVSEVTPAQFTDITAGKCVIVRPTPETATATGGAVTAHGVELTQPVDGKCPQPKAPAASPNSTAPSAPPPAAANHRVQGTVGSVANNTITVTDTDANGNPSQTTVTVTDQTKYSKQGPANAQAIAQGKCITARGTKNAGGTVQATAISLWPADNGKCW